VYEKELKIIDAPQTVIELLRHTRGEAQVWPMPEIPTPRLLPVPPFDANVLLPGVLRAFCEDVAHRMQCPIDFVAVTVVCMLGSVIGARCAVRPKQNDDWTEVPNLWGGVVASPGKLKSPAISEGFSPLRFLEADAQRDHQAELASYAAKKMDQKFEIEVLSKLVKKVKNTEALQASSDFERLREVHKQADNPPKLRRYRTNDATIEKLGELLAFGRPGMLVECDELTTLFSSFEQRGHEGYRAFFLQAWNGLSSHRIDRIGRGEIYIPHLCVSVFGGIQPTKLEQYIFELRNEANDGLIQRFHLLVFPNEIGIADIIDKVPNADAKSELIEIVRRLASVNFEALGAAKDQENGVPYFRFEAEKAQPEFIVWLGQLEQKIAFEDDPFIREHLAKYRKMVPALALIFHLVHHVKEQAVKIPPISKDNLNRAIQWSDYLLPHARRIYGMAADSDVTAAAALAKKIETGDLHDGFSERDVYRANWVNLSMKELVAAACRELEAAGWIRRRQIIPGKGRRPTSTYDINPQLKK
jgi:hypothetical protein